MILLDSSVIFDHLRGKDPKLAGLFTTLPVAVCGIVRAETLHGAKDAADRTRLIVFLGQFLHVPIPDTIWDTVGDNLCMLRTHGVTVTFPDAVLATVALVNDIELWTRDAHFALVQKWLSALKLFQEPP